LGTKITFASRRDLQEHSPAAGGIFRATNGPCTYRSADVSSFSAQESRIRHRNRRGERDSRMSRLMSSVSRKMDDSRVYGRQPSPTLDIRVWFIMGFPNLGWLLSLSFWTRRSQGRSTALQLFPRVCMANIIMPERGVGIFLIWKPRHAREFPALCAMGNSHFYAKLYRICCRVVWSVRCCRRVRLRNFARIIGRHYDESSTCEINLCRKIDKYHKAYIYICTYIDTFVVLRPAGHCERLPVRAGRQRDQLQHGVFTHRAPSTTTDTKQFRYF
jgi:hypothetical protein